MGIQLLQIGPYLLELPSWFVPGLTKSLISTRLLDQAGYSILTESNVVLICKQDLTITDWHKLADTTNPT